MDLQHILQSGFELHQAGQLSEARAKYQDVLKHDPANFDALQLSGVIAAQLGELNLALELLIKANAIKPQDLAVATNLAKAASDLGNYAVAIQALRTILQTKNNDPHLIFALALNYFHVQDYRQSIQYFDFALQLRPNWAEAHCNRANAYDEMHEHEKALVDLNMAIELDPDYAIAHFNRGNILQKMRQLDLAQSNFERAINIQPSLKQAHLNLSQLYFHRGDYHAAYAASDTALALDPHHVSGYNCRGLAAMELGDYATARKDFESAIAIQPDFIHAYTNLGKLFRYTNQHAAAIASYRTALAIDPTSAIALFGLGLCELQIGDFFNGWAHYEERWHPDVLSDPKLIKNFSQTRWDGHRTLSGKCILLYAEQGYGDTIQFCRYARKIKALGAHVVLEIPSALFALFENLEGVDQLVARGEALPHFDFHLPLMSLPYVLRSNIAGIFALPPYLSVSQSKKDQWQKLLSDCLGKEIDTRHRKKQKRIGLVWSGNPQFKNDSSRSISLEQLIHYLPQEAVYFCLQKEVSIKDKVYLNTRPEIQQFSNQLHDFSDTAALCSHLDLVVTVDTSVAHLAGALGIPTIILLAANSDWRWLLHHDKTPWYESVSLIRQARVGQWIEALSMLANKLRDFIRA
ncbi:tetratricopeptide repeat protein [Undibacterium fentianense]|uniref:Tetratricopeptide repeat protein n=1 Tax=Undibacterium fentianense TaxID=2828728 RepID=A0A941IDZ4_9BURK|nr:tetratricopeptide repeat protein [Undibacterium fentianense]MBR7799096.1 tetratricopeptide repeat protein [Undibacterium fentianense]